MDKLINAYLDKYEKLFRISNITWNTGVIILSIVFCLKFCSISNLINWLNAVFLFALIITALNAISLFIYKIELMRYYKEEINLKNLNNKKIICYENKLDKEQKDFITNYVRKNKISKVGKLQIIINELQEKINSVWYNKYKEMFIIPAILSFAMSIIQYDEKIGLAVYLLQSIFVVVFVIVVTKGFNEICHMAIFNKYMGLKRLKELLVNVALKHGK